jgi:hypothetical protein
MLYPVELRAQLFEIIAPTGTARRQSPSRIKGANAAPAKVVGVEGFELSTSSSQSWRSTRLSYTPPTISIALLQCRQKARDNPTNLNQRPRTILLYRQNRIVQQQ